MYLTQYSILPMLMTMLISIPSGPYIGFTLVAAQSDSIWESFKAKVNMIGKTIAGSACLATVAGPIAKCQEAYDQEMQYRLGRNEPHAIAQCCAYNELNKCVTSIAVRECGNDGRMVAKGMVNQITRMATNEDCVNYGPIACLKYQEVMIAIGFFALIMLSCVYCCWCLIKIRRNAAFRMPENAQYKSVNGNHNGKHNANHNTNHNGVANTQMNGKY